jgi:Tfp pilus assembly protein PilN
MKKINLLPWREQQNKLKTRQFAIVWFGVSCSCLILLFITKILIVQQIKHYQLAHESVLLQIKIVSPIVQKIKELQFLSKQLMKIIKIIQVNHQQVIKILDFMNHLKYLITPDIYMRLIEFHSPFLSLVMHANSEKEYLSFIKFLQFKYDPKLRWLILNKSQDLQLDFIVQMLFDKN